MLYTMNLVYLLCVLAGVPSIRCSPSDNADVVPALALA